MTPLPCVRCKSDHVVKMGSVLSARGRIQRYQCMSCGKKFHPSVLLSDVPRRESYLDIEASQAGRGAGNFGIMYSWALKLRDGPVLSDVIKRRTPKDEKRILGTLLEALKKTDLVYTWYGTGYDIPMIRTRCVYHGLPFPEYMMLFHRDLYYIGRRLFKLHANRLEAHAEFHGVKGKTPLKPDVWVKASFGDPQALKYILKHNKGDVIILEGVHKKMEPFYRGNEASV